MNGKRMLALASLLLVAVTAPASAASPVLYVAATEEYAVAFKSEGAELYALELSGKSDCFFTEPREHIGFQYFAVFPSPTPMRSSSDGLVAEDNAGQMAAIRAELAEDSVTGDFYYHEIKEEGFHCDSRISPNTFRASRHEPATSTGATTGAGGSVFYGIEESIETFLRTTEKEAAGIRGSFVPRCRVGREKQIPLRASLFPFPVSADLSEDGSFEQRVVERGWTPYGIRFKEVMVLDGSVEGNAVTGTYFRVRAIKRRAKPPRRCISGPIPFRATRYVRAVG